MPRWTAFAGLTAVLLFLLLGLARLSQSQVTGADEVDPDPGVDGIDADPGSDPDTDPVPDPDDADEDPAVSRDDPPGSAEGQRFDARDSPPARPAHREVGHSPTRETDLPPGALVANVALSQGLFGSLLVAGAWLFAIPPATLGLADRSLSALTVGLGLGAGLYVVNEVGSVVAERMGIGPDERLRELLAPDSLRGWILLLGVALPVVAGVEELLFRAALVGAIPAGFGVSPWAMALLSSVAFGFAHGAQGRAGIAVAGGLGFVLAAAFVLTESLLVVFVAHYLVNALEFLVHEGLDVDWGR